MTKLFFTILFTTATFAQVFGQQKFLLQPKKVFPSDQKWADLQSQYNSIPTDKLRVVEKDLDSTISTSDCYKFLHNADSTKFIAFFIMRKANPKFDRLVHFGRTVQEYYRPSEKDSVEYLSYTLWGMKYNGNWFYDKENESEFWDNTDKNAKIDYLFSILNDIGFLKIKKPESFWKDGGETNLYRILPQRNSYLSEYAGQPEIVGFHKVFHLRRQKDLLNENIEKISCTIADDLWIALHESDSLTFHSRYKSKHSGKSCLVLYNSERSKILLPVIYYDNKSQPWLTYYFVKNSFGEMTCYRWTKIPTKKIKRETGRESLEVVYDIRAFIENWNWGTVNLIENENFWTNNFMDTNLELIKK
jgi:hypothetical protein